MQSVIPYSPEFCGKASSEGKVSIFGLAYDPANALVAVSMQGPATLIEKFHFSIQGQDFNLSIEPIVSGDYWRHCYSRKYHYKQRKTPIPDTHDVSLILLNDSLYKVVDGMTYSHVWYRSQADFKRELFMRVRSMTYTAVKEEWSSYLYTYGMSQDTRSQRGLCGRLVNRKDSSDWMCAGFDIAYISTSREAWEKLIVQGLQKQLISV